ncbi:antibiotic biosynthesis monooxygenase [Cyanobium sp. Morenito 9A2]|uniref:antibiotic biosynthesis monooxygenase n=1 Tax=Cyanobium sp. Morenito 9A2 TaxID=2823718 RepID=UPI0020CFCC5B|nr:antibiotic biosynthesis monooxygenase [Cyanobium sp. Morenito 9A2]MCP9851246.1 antibiotic biosynthesis monooxygenase [Cyanobium sp. Morenito 9A2]
MADPVTLIASGRVHAGMGKALAGWHARQADALSRQSGFLSTDLLPPRSAAKGETWTIRISFASPEELEAWQSSTACHDLLAAAAPLLVGGVFEERREQADAYPGSRSDVTEVIFSKVRAGMSEQFRSWAQRIQAAQASYPGYLGMYLQPPQGGGEGHWVTILRYDSASHLEAWMNSRQRADLLAESRQFMEREELVRITSSFPGWVPVDPVSGQAPPNWKTAMLVLLGLYPIVMLELRLLSPILSGLGIHGALATFIGNSISVALTSFLTMPWFVQTFNWWLFPGLASPRALTRRGVQIVCLLYLLEVAVLWKLLPF